MSNRGQTICHGAAAPLEIQCACGIVKWVPTTEITISLPKFSTNRKIQLVVGVVPGLTSDMLIGSDIFLNNPDLIARENNYTGDVTQVCIATRRHDYSHNDERHGDSAIDDPQLDLTAYGTLMNDNQKVVMNPSA